MKLAKRSCTILIGLGVFAMPMLGQGDRVVVAWHSGSEIRVSIAQTTPLGTVLDEVCREMNAQCLGTQQTMAAMVPAQEVRGDWRQVISILLEGAGFNYVAGTPSGSSLGRLEIVGTSQGRGEQPEVRSADAAKKLNQTGVAGERSPDGPALSGLPNAGVQPSMEASSEPETASVDAAPLSASMPAPPTSGAEGPGQARRASGVEQTAMGGQPDSLLFPDGYGNSIPASHSQDKPDYP